MRYLDIYNGCNRGDVKYIRYCDENNTCQPVPKGQEDKFLSQEKTVKKENKATDYEFGRYDKKSIVFIFDDSGSMGTENKLQLAKEGSAKALDIVKNSEISLLSFNGCKIDEDAIWSTENEKIKEVISGFSARSSTPIAKSLEHAYSLLDNKTDADQSRYVILFTDGEETCSGNPCGVVKRHENSSKVPIYTIGYIVGDKAKEQLKCIADFSGGKYFDAASPEEINDALASAFRTVMDVQCREDSDCAEYEICAVSGQCIKAKIHLAFVPVNWNSGLDEFKLEVDDQTAFFKYSIPSLNNCSDLIKITKLEKSCNFVVDRHSNKSDLDKIEACIKKETNSFDFAIGVGEDNTFDGIAGYTAPKRALFIERGNEIVLAHELGHKFGLNDEYCYCPDTGICGGEPNPLKAEYGCDPNGNCVWGNGKGQLCFVPGTGRSCRTGYEQYGCYKCAEGNKNELGGRSIMSDANAEGPRYHDKPSLEHLAKDPRLRCD